MSKAADLSHAVDAPKLRPREHPARSVAGLGGAIDEVGVGATASRGTHARRASRTLVITPTFNERGNLPAFIDSFRAALPDAHLLVVDDASPDGTGAIADAFARVDAGIRVLHRPRKLGLGSAYREALLQGMDEGYERFAQLDADLSHDPGALPGLFAALDDGADVAVGSRRVAGGQIDGWGPFRRALSAGGSRYARAVIGIDVADVTSGFKAFTRDAVRAIDIGRVESRGYAFQIETTVRALNAGLRVDEVPIRFLDRRRGSSKMSVGIALEAVVAVWNLRRLRERGRRGGRD